jgi:hypothetical protein
MRRRTLMLIGESPVFVGFYRERSSGEAECLSVFEQAHEAVMPAVRIDSMN